MVADRDAVNLASSSSFNLAGEVGIDRWHRSQQFFRGCAVALGVCILPLRKSYSPQQRMRGD